MNKYKISLILIVLVSLVLISFKIGDSQTGLDPIKKELSELKSSINVLKTKMLFNDKRASILLKRLDEKSNLEDRLLVVEELLNAGRLEEALTQLSHMKKDNINRRSLLYEYYRLQGLIYLRFGELNNCCSRPDINYCTFPISRESTYLNTKHSLQAIAIFDTLLSLFPNDPFAKWGKVLGEMTSGNYMKYPSTIYENLDSVSDLHFENKGHDLGLDVFGLAGGSIMDDFNNDGYLDIICSDWDLSGQLKYFINQGDGTFIDATEESGLIGEVGGLHIVQADVNNDGWLDLFIPRGSWLGANGKHPNSLLVNNGKGEFVNQTIDAGLYSKFPSQVTAFTDFNNDGLLDIFIGNESRRKNFKSEFYLNKGNCVFEEISHNSSFEVNAYVKGATWGDINNDGLSDLFISVLNGENYLLINESTTDSIHFRNVAKQWNVNLPIKSFPTFFWDMNNDGLEDLYVSNYKFDHSKLMSELLNDAIFENDKDVPGVYLNKKNKFKNIYNEVGLNKVLYSMSANYGDFDNNGELDFYLGTGAPSFDATVPNRMFVSKDGIFYEVTASAEVGHLQKGHGISIGDIDNDGDQDIYHVLGGAVSGDKFFNALYLNNSNDSGNKNWVTLKFEGVKSNYFGIGNRIHLTITDGSKQRHIHRTITTGSSFGSSSLQCEIGFPKDYKIQKLEVYWPASKTKQTFGNIKSEHIYIINEESDNIKTFNLPKIVL